METQNASDSASSNRKSFRLLRPSIVVLCGPAACGKSTFARKHFRPTQIISSDWARAQVCDDERDQRFNAQAFSLVHFIVEQRIMANRLCVVDSTALTAQARKDLLELARKHQVPATLVLLDAPLETCVERDEKRERSVGRAVIERHHRTFEQTRATIGQEGFTQILEIGDGDQEKVQIEILFRPVVRPSQHSNGDSNRRFDGSAKPAQARQNRPRDNGHALPAPSPAVVRPSPGPVPAVNPVALQAPKPANPAIPATSKMVAKAPTAPETPVLPQPAGVDKPILRPSVQASARPDVNNPQKMSV